MTESWGGATTDFVEQARIDVGASEDRDSPDFAALGLTTIARLLSASEPFRVRWALQHAPYPVAKLIRLKMRTSSQILFGTELVEFENTVLRIAWERMIEEGRLDQPWGGWR